MRNILCFVIEKPKQKIGCPVWPKHVTYTVVRCKYACAVLGMKTTKSEWQDLFFNHVETRSRTWKVMRKVVEEEVESYHSSQSLKHASADWIVVSGGGQRQSSAGMTCKVSCESVLLLRHQCRRASY